MKLCLSCITISVVVTTATGLSSTDSQLDFIQTRNEIFFGLNGFEAANVSHSRKKRFLAFPPFSVLILTAVLFAPLSNVPGVNQMSFFSQFRFFLGNLFPLPPQIATTTMAPITTTTASKYGAPPIPNEMYKTIYGDHVGYRVTREIGDEQDYNTAYNLGAGYYNDDGQFEDSNPFFDSSPSNDDVVERFDRIPFYEYLEDFMNSRGYNGKQCVLRTICEVADAPFDQGIFGELVNLIMSASMGTTEFGDYDDYMKAEHYGRHFDDCHKKYHECRESVLELISGIF